MSFNSGGYRCKITEKLIGLLGERSHLAPDEQQRSHARWLKEALQEAYKLAREEYRKDRHPRSSQIPTWDVGP